MNAAKAARRIMAKQYSQSMVDGSEPIGVYKTHMDGMADIIREEYAPTCAQLEVAIKALKKIGSVNFGKYTAGEFTAIHALGEIGNIQIYRGISETIEKSEPVRILDL